MTTENLKKIKVSSVGGKERLYIDGLIILDKINTVYYDGAIYRAMNNEIVTALGKHSIISLVQRGFDVYFLS